MSRTFKLCAALWLALLLSMLCGCSDVNLDQQAIDPYRELSDYYSEQESDEAENASAAFTLPYLTGESLDPLTCPDGAQLTLSRLLYEPLYELDETFTAQPVLVRSVSYDAQNYVYTVSLHTTAQFWDGTTLTAQDAVSTLRRAAATLRYGERLKKIVSLSVVDEGTFTIRLMQDDPHFTALLDIPVVKSGTENSLVPTGTGPYIIDNEGGALWRNDQWWRSCQLPYEHIPLLPCKSEEAASYAFRARDVHLLSCDTLNDTNGLAHTGGQCVDAGDTTMHFLYLNPNSSSLQDASVRRALSLAIDREQLVTAYLVSHATAAQFPIHPASPLYPQALHEPFDEGEVRQALSELELADGEDKTQLYFIVNEENPFKVDAAHGIAEMLERYDFEVTVTVLPWEDYLYRLEIGGYDLCYGECRLTANWDLWPLLGSGGSANYNYMNPVTEEALLAFAAAGDEVQIAGAETLCRYLKQEMPLITLCFKSRSVLLAEDAQTDLLPTAVNPFYSWTAEATVKG